MLQQPLSKKPIINCHTHIFTGDHVPPFLAKTFVPPPLHLLLPLSFIVKAFRIYYNRIQPLQFKSWYKRLKKNWYHAKVYIARNLLVKILAYAVALWLTIQVFFILFDWLTALIPSDAKGGDTVNDVRVWLSDRYLLHTTTSTWLKLAMVLAVMLFVKTGRNLILFVFKKLWSFFRMLPGPQSRELINRYISIGRFSFHRQQKENYKRLRNQYPDDTGFIVLPMDMEFMDAGDLKPGFKYHDQMRELRAIKENINYRDRFFPFVFVDPRRMEKEQDFFQYERSADNRVVLKDCFIKEYIEEHRFSGFKIYPALGYYPFDHALLPLWKYAADNCLPILTHCIRGNIFYRGSKRKDWDYHPIFEQAKGKGEYEPLLLHQMKNIDFINNFTHPLNYLCLLEEKLLRKWVGKANNDIKQMFGYTNDETALTSDLHHLKLCFGHFGGEDEWKRFFEFDRDNYASQLVKQPNWGIDFLTDDRGVERRGKPEQVWRDVDWYSIICSLMLQFPNVYSDLSYILHDLEIQPLLRKTLQNDKLKRRTLFGTDFYVVRNHKSEKHMLADMLDHLEDHEFDTIARDNPAEFLANCLPLQDKQVQEKQDQEAKPFEEKEIKIADETVAIKLIPDTHNQVPIKDKPSYDQD